MRQYLPRGVTDFWTMSIIVKLQSKVQASVLGLGVDFVFPLSQEEEEQEQPHQNITEKSILEVGVLDASEFRSFLPNSVDFNPLVTL